MAQDQKTPETRPNSIQFRVTWSFVWSLWWRWMVFSLVGALIAFIVIIIFLYRPF